jgi:hypothetical protein
MLSVFLTKYQYRQTSLSLSQSSGDKEVLRTKYPSNHYLKPNDEKSADHPAREIGEMGPPRQELSGHKGILVILRKEDRTFQVDRIWKWKKSMIKLVFRYKRRNRKYTKKHKFNVHLLVITGGDNDCLSTEIA